MKTGFGSIFSGVTSAHVLFLAGLIVIGGCTSPKVLGPRRYIAAPMDEPATKLEVEDTKELIITPKTDEVKPEVKGSSKNVSDYPPINTVETVPVTSPEKTYTVQKNDNLWKIARQFGVSFIDLAAYNDLPVSKPLYVGKVLRIPSATYKATPSDKKKISSGIKHVKAKKTKKVKTDASTAAAVTVSGGGKYVVRNGDNPWLIAKRFKVKLSDLLKANGLNEKSMLKVGQTLVIPSGTMPAAAATLNTEKKTGTKPAESVDKVLDSVETPTTPDVKATPAATGTDPKVIEDKTEKPAATAPKEAADDLGFGKQIETISDTTVAKLAAKYNTSVDKLQLLNPTIAEDGQIKKGTLIQLPKK